MKWHVDARGVGAPRIELQTDAGELLGVKPISFPEWQFWSRVFAAKPPVAQQWDVDIPGPPHVSQHIEVHLLRRDLVERDND